jgi:hypothetical protein
MLSKVYRLATDKTGTAGIEFAIVVIPVMTLLLGASAATLSVVANMYLTNAAESVASLVAQQSSVNSSSIANFCTAGRLSMWPLSGAPLQVAIASVTNSGSGPAVDWQDTSCGNGASMSDPLSLASGLIPRPGDSVIVVQASYRYTSSIQWIFPTATNMTQDSFQRPRNGASVGHS